MPLPFGSSLCQLPVLGCEVDHGAPHAADVARPGGLSANFVPKAGLLGDRPSAQVFASDLAVGLPVHLRHYDAPFGRYFSASFSWWLTRLSNAACRRAAWSR